MRKAARRRAGVVDGGSGRRAAAAAIPRCSSRRAAPELDYVAVADSLPLPAGTTMGAPASVAFDAKGHLWVLTRGPQPLFEFDANGAFIRAFGEGLFTRTHGLRFDRDGNIWVSDVGAHIVVKLNPHGQVLLTLGVEGRGRRLGRSRRIAPAQPAERRRVRPRRRHLRRAGAHARRRRAMRASSSSIAPAASSSRGAEKARSRASSRSRTASRSTRRACSG